MQADKGPLEKSRIDVPQHIQPDSELNAEQEDLNQQLFHAIDTNDLKTVKKLLEAKILTLNVIEEEPSILPHELGDLINQFLPYADLCVRTGPAPLFWAAHKGDAALVKALIDVGADVNACESICKTTPLLIAVVDQKYDVAEILLKAHANPDIRDWLGKTPLHYAAQFGNKRFVQLLIAYEADPFISDNELPAIPAKTPRQEAQWCRNWINTDYRQDLEKIIELLEAYERSRGLE
jgi:hypothetical protein